MKALINYISVRFEKGIDSISKVLYDGQKLAPSETTWR